jgi:hypothetical protein
MHNNLFITSPDRMKGFKAVIIAGSFALLAAVAHGGTATYNFDTDPSTQLKIVGNNQEPWQAKGGNPATGGFMAITYPVGSQYTGVLFPDIDAGKIVTAFKFECDLRVGNSTGDRPADGFSVSFARSTDPLLAEIDSGGAATGPFAGGVPEAGSTTGIAISFDTWSGNSLPDGPDIEGIIIRVDNVSILKQPMPTRHGACADTTSLQTGPRDAAYWGAGGDPNAPESWAGLCWQPFSIDLDAAGKLTVKYKGKTILDQFQTTYFPTPGRLILAGRTGGANEHTHFDNIKLTTVSVTDASPPTAPSNLKATAVHSRRIKLTWDAGTDDSGRVAYEIDRDGTLLPGFVSGTSFADGKVKPDTSYTYKIRSVDPAQNKSAFTAAVTVKTPPETTTFQVGVMKWEAFKDIGGTSLDPLKDSDKFKNNEPDEVRVVAGYEGPTNVGDNYGARITGFITPETTGSYIFFMSTDDNGELYLSTDDKSANKVLIASEPQWGAVRAWTAPDRRPGCPDACENRSAPIRLEGGKRYFTELLYKEGGGGDNGAVTWIKQGDPLPANGSPPLRGKLIGSFADPNAGPPSITSQPVGASLPSGGKATLSASAIGTPPLTYEWSFQAFGQRAGSPVAGATTASLAAAEAGIYSVTVKNDEGSSASAPAMVVTEGTLFIEAEDFNFGGGNYIKDKPIGMSGSYPGGAFRDLGTDADAGIDFNNPGGNAGQPYRSTTPVAAGKPNQHSDGLPRGSFDVGVNHVVGWNDAGDWQNYTRVFPEPAKDYTIVGRLSSGGNAINGQLDEVTAGAKTANQTLKKIGAFKPGRATAGWDIMEWFPLIDDAGKPVTVKLGGEKTFRFTTLPDANLDIDYMMFIPVGGPTPPPPTAPRFTKVFKQDANRIVLEWIGAGTLQQADSVTGPWTDVANASSPRTITPAGSKFYRLR